MIIYFFGILILSSFIDFFLFNLKLKKSQLKKFFKKKTRNIKWKFVKKLTDKKLKIFNVSYEDFLN